jgi:hypothetical protein
MRYLKSDVVHVSGMHIFYEGVVDCLQYIVTIIAPALARLNPSFVLPLVPAFHNTKAKAALNLSPRVLG